MKNKKMLMVVAVAAAAMVMLAGCGKKDKTPSCHGNLNRRVREH